jgi:hypothetical protein
MQTSLQVVSRPRPALKGTEKLFIELIAEEVCNGIHGAVGAWMAKVEAILASGATNEEKLATIGALVNRSRECQAGRAVSAAAI